jgi:hypothetical protein
MGKIFQVKFFQITDITSFMRRSEHFMQGSFSGDLQLRYAFTAAKIFKEKNAP